MTGEWFEGLIILVILAGIAVAIFKGGAANPVGTGGLNTSLTKLDSDFKALGVKVGAVDTKLGEVETRVGELDARAATKGDIQRIETRFDVWERKLEQLDTRLDATDLELGKIQTITLANRTATEAMAESMRALTETVQKIEARTEANAVITAQVPAFMERVLTAIAGNAAQTDHNTRQVERLYDFLTEKALK